MKNRPLHQNLDTSFVNLSALIKYLRRRQFLGSVKVQLNGYDAEIELQKDNKMSVREHDQISGRTATGEEAFQRVLIRAREPGGTINVFQSLEATPLQKSVPPKVEKPKEEVKTDTILEAEIIEIAEVKNTPTKASQNGNSNSRKVKAEQKPPKSPPAKQEKTLPDFPFALTNKVEAKAKSKEISVKDWQMLLKLTVEILTVVDKTLAQANLDFTAAFRKARTEIADDYPFLNPSSHIFDYKQGKLKMTERVNEKIFVASIMEALRRILEKLESNPKFESIHRHASQTLIALLNKRKPQYDKLSITPHLKRILGI